MLKHQKPEDKNNNIQNDIAAVIVYDMERTVINEKENIWMTGGKNNENTTRI